MSSFPFDVWAQIARWLPSECLCSLYGVNKALFKLSLDERYRHLELVRRDADEVHKKLRHLEKDQFRAEKVKELTLALHWAEGWLYGYDGYDWGSAVRTHGLAGLYPQSRKKVKRWIAVKKRGIITEETESKLILLQRSLDTVLSLPNIHRCTITDRVRSEHEFTLPTTAIPFVHAAWKVSSASLQYLHLDILVEMMEDVLAPGLTFEGLKQLEIDLSMLYRSTDTMGIVLSTLVPFINRHHHLLHTFAFRTKEHLPLNQMFTQLHTMPHVRTLGISHGYVSTLQTDMSGLQDFLARHAEELRSLSLSFHALGTNMVLDPSLTDWSEQAFLHISYPKLEKLFFKFFDFPEGFSEKISVVLDGYWGDTLRSLELGMSSPDRELKVEDVRSIFSSVPKEANLHSLCLTVDLVTMDLLSALSEALPNLVALELKLPSKGDNGISTPQDVPENHEFDIDTVKRTYGARWGLRHFSISRC